MRLRDVARATAPRCSAEVLSGRYRLEEHLGSGGAAEVHRGFDLRLRRPVAVKIFRPGAGFDDDESLHNEAMILARLHHPGLVTAYDAGQHDGRDFLVMQLIEGDTLKSRIAEGPLTAESTAELGAGLAHALSHAHEAGIVHRDVKPSNILLDADHGPHLADFGISRLVDGATRTATGTLVGTAAYLSPEQVRGRPAGRPADVYALGLVLLECLTGRREYEGGPIEAAIARLHRQPVLPDGLPDGLSTLLKDMTAVQEGDRPTAPECACVLTALTDGAGPASEGSPSLTSLTSLIAGSGPSPASQDSTHPAPDGARTVSRTAPVRARAFMAGAAVALAAVTATGLAATDSSTPQNGDRGSTTASGASPGKSEQPGSEEQRKPAPTSAAESRPGPGASAGTSPEHAVGQSPGSDARDATGEPAAPADAPDSAAATAAREAPSGRNASAAAGRGASTAEPPQRPPGQAKKDRQAENKVRQAENKGRQKKADKAASHR
ncbi:serine/threonine-protein kinase [Streptomyces pratensis]|uniref:serine/threonine-protein kinase n=1 Tax=Streptomyces pratensis TaxID=1169025 RepID=UPI00301A6D3E